MTRNETLMHRGRPRADRVAHLVTELLAPVPVTVGLLVAVVWHSAPDIGAALRTGAVAVLFVGVLPAAFVLLGVRRGRWPDHHLPDREDRRVPLLVALASVLVGLGILAATGAPREVVALVVATVAGLLVGLAVTAFWKMSVHSSVAAGSAVVLVMVFGPVAALAVPLAAAVGWSRLVLRAHTPAQVLVGLVVGALVAGTVFSAVR